MEEERIRGAATLQKKQVWGLISIDLSSVQLVSDLLLNPIACFMLHHFRPAVDSGTEAFAKCDWHHERILHYWLTAVRIGIA